MDDHPTVLDNPPPLKQKTVTKRKPAEKAPLFNFRR